MVSSLTLTLLPSRLFRRASERPSPRSPAVDVPSLRSEAFAEDLGAQYAAPVLFRLGPACADATRRALLQCLAVAVCALASAAMLTLGNPAAVALVAVPGEPVAAADIAALGGSPQGLRCG